MQTRTRISAGDDAETMAAKLRRMIETKERNRRPADANRLRALLAAVEMMGRVDRRMGGAALETARALRAVNGHCMEARPLGCADLPAVRLRLYGVTAPTGNEPLSDRARQKMAKWESQMIAYDPIRTDAWGRIYAVVHLAGPDGPAGASLNARMLEAGLARITANCGREICRRWEWIEERARAARNGVWAEAEEAQ
ncbi:MAG: thermonuclease family protein [Desulfococcaceae bacterium]